MKQASLKAFMKSSTVGSTATTNDPAASTSTSSRAAPAPSSSKIPLPASPLKRPPTSQAGATKSLLFSLGSTSTGAGIGSVHATSGRSLSNLSHALDKLAAPPPSRPNTSMGFVRDEGTSDDEDSGAEKGKGKGKAKDDTSLPATSITQSSATRFARPTASSLKRAVTVTGFGPTAAGMRGRGGAAVGGTWRERSAGGIFGKTGDRASKKTNLPVVVGSPVKGSGTTSGLDRENRGVGKPKLSLGVARGVGGLTGDEDVFVSQEAASTDGLEQDTVMEDVSAESSMGASAASHKPAATNANAGIDLTTSPISADKGKQRAVSFSTLNPASSALHALSESLSSLPQTPTPPKPKVVGTRTGLRSSTAATGKESPLLDGHSEVHGSGGAGPSNGTVNGSGGVKKSSLKILKRCAIFVDVRTEQGDDAGSLFVDMLKGLGAKVSIVLFHVLFHFTWRNEEVDSLWVSRSWVGLARRVHTSYTRMGIPIR